MGRPAVRVEDADGVDEQAACVATEERVVGGGEVVGDDPQQHDVEHEHEPAHRLAVQHLADPGQDDRDAEYEERVPLGKSSLQVGRTQPCPAIIGG